jgi:hypothetical protein
MDAVVHDVAFLSGGEDQRHERPHPVDHAPQVGVEDAVPLVERELPRGAAVHDAGVVHRDVQTAVPLHGFTSDRVDTYRVAHVAPHGRDITADPLRMRRDRVLVDVGHDHLHAF